MMKSVLSAALIVSVGRRGSGPWSTVTNSPFFTLLVI